MGIKIGARDYRIVSMWLRGVNGEVMAKELRIHRRYLTDRARMLGLPKRASGPQPAPNYFPTIVAWAKSGWSEEEIAIQIGCDKPEDMAEFGKVWCGGSRGVPRETASPQLVRRRLKTLLANKRKGLLETKALVQGRRAECRNVEKVTRAMETAE